jgi:hypothetical protein
MAQQYSSISDDEENNTTTRDDYPFNTNRRICIAMTSITLLVVVSYIVASVATPEHQSITSFLLICVISLAVMYMVAMVVISIYICARWRRPTVTVHDASMATMYK